MMADDTQTNQTTPATETAPTTETKPAEATTQTTETTKPAETKPTETKPAETKPDEGTKPTETKPAEPDYKAQAMGYAAQAINAKAESALSALGVPQAKLAVAVKMADLGGINLDDPKASEKIAAAAAKVLELVPEFKGGAGTGSTVATPRKPGTLDDFQRGYLGAK